MLFKLTGHVSHEGYTGQVQIMQKIYVVWIQTVLKAFAGHDVIQVMQN
jgi:hypothetical protein